LPARRFRRRLPLLRPVVEAAAVVDVAALALRLLAEARPQAVAARLPARVRAPLPAGLLVEPHPLVEDAAAGDAVVVERARARLQFRLPRSRW
jgi:hypothetical protein